MEVFRPARGKGLIFLSLITVVFDIVLFILMWLSNTYELRYAFILLLLVFSIYQLYYILGYISLKYEFNEDTIIINRCWGMRKIFVPVKNIKAYKIQEYKMKEIEGLKISGYFIKDMIFGKAIINKIGATHMFITNSRNVIFLSTEEINYCLSPIDMKRFEDKLKACDIKNNELANIGFKGVKLYKEKKYLAIIIICAILLIVIPSIPMVLYLQGKMPALMPLSFDKNFIATKLGTAQQFVFKQTIYGILNMAIFFCFYFASYFFQKYDKRTAYGYLYLGVIICLSIMILQIKVLYTFVR